MITRKAKRKLAFTLSELLIVMTLIALILSSLQWGVGKMLRHHAFKQEVSQLREVIALTQELMMDTRGDFTLALHHLEGSGLSVQLHSNQALPQKFTAMIEKMHGRKVMQLFFEGVAVKELLLHFEGDLGRISKGTLLLKGPGGVDERIVLHGFPGRLR